MSGIIHSGPGTQTSSTLTGEPIKASGFIDTSGPPTPGWDDEREGRKYASSILHNAVEEWIMLERYAPATESELRERKAGRTLANAVAEALDIIGLTYGLNKEGK